MKPASSNPRRRCSTSGDDNPLPDVGGSSSALWALGATWLRSVTVTLDYMPRQVVPVVVGAGDGQRLVFGVLMTPTAVPGVHIDGSVHRAPPARSCSTGSSHRLFNCARCRRQVRLCSPCDLGQRYCGRLCATEARRESLRTSRKAVPAVGPGPSTACQQAATIPGPNSRDASGSSITSRATHICECEWPAIGLGNSHTASKKMVARGAGVTRPAVHTMRNARRRLQSPHLQEAAVVTS